MTEIVDAEIVGDNLPAVRASQAIVARDEITVDDLVAQADKVKQAMQRAMKPGVHYGLIPGVNKPSLFKPGAETLCVLLRLAPAYESERIWHDDGHLTVVSRVRLQHIPTGFVVAEGEGLCSSRESKYGYRNADRTCPKCGSSAIIRGKQEYGGGWVCFKKKGGCGAKYATADQAIAGQQTGRVTNPDLPDTFNTVLKMANKRALVAAVLNGTAASDIFTQDVEDSPQDSGLEPSGRDPVREPVADAQSTVSPVAASASSPEHDPTEPADLALAGHADRLEERLLEHSTTLDVDLGLVREAVAGKRNEHAGDPDLLVAWLEQQVNRAEAALAARAEQKFESPIASPKQQTLMKTAASKAGLDDDARHELVERVTGQPSTKAVGRHQVQAVLDAIAEVQL